MINKSQIKIFIFTFLIILNLISCTTEKLVQENSINLSANIISKSTMTKSDDEISIVVIPDTQSYLDFRCQKGIFKDFPINQYEIYFNQMKYIADNSVSNNGKFDFAIHVGDLVDHRSWNMTEWKRAEEGFKTLYNNIPFLTVIGNHDYDRWGKNNVPIGTKLYNKYFGKNSSFAPNYDLSGGFSESSANSWKILEKNNIKILIIGLELDPSNEAIEWAQKIINQNPGIPTIIVTHSYLTTEKESYNNHIQNSFSNKYQYKDKSRNSAKELNEKLISKNDQVLLILCGHSFNGNVSEGLRIETNNFGNKNFAILSDYQGRNENLKNIGYKNYEKYGCGDGWLRILTFNIENKELHVQTYSTLFNEYDKSNESDFILDLSYNWEQRFPGTYK